MVEAKLDPHSTPVQASVCIPAYAGARHIASTIESVLQQSFADFELVVVDDNSPDDTATVVEQYRDPRVRFLRNARNLGPEGNWNKCLMESRGHYVKLLPQDDLLERTCLERQVAVLDMDAAENISLVFCARNIVNGTDQVLLTRGYPARREGAIPSEAIIRGCLRRGTNLVGEPGGVLFRRSLAARVGPFDASIGYLVDLDYWFRLLLHGMAYYIPDRLASFRVAQGSWSVAIGSKQSAEFRRFIAKVSANPAFQISGTDRAAGNLMARLNNVMRMVVYKVVVRP